MPGFEPRDEPRVTALITAAFGTLATGDAVAAALQQFDLDDATRDRLVVETTAALEAIQADGPRATLQTLLADRLSRVGDGS